MAENKTYTRSLQNGNYVIGKHKVDKVDESRIVYRLLKVEPSQTHLISDNFRIGEKENIDNIIELLKKAREKL